jgi:hypothetical protein
MEAMFGKLFSITSDPISFFRAAPHVAAVDYLLDKFISSTALEPTRDLTSLIVDISSLVEQPKLS